MAGAGRGGGDGGVRVGAARPPSRGGRYCRPPRLAEASVEIVPCTGGNEGSLLSRPA